MGLYNNVADSLSGLGLGGNFLGKLDGAIRTGAEQAGTYAGTALGGGKLATAVTQAGATIGGGIVSSQMNSHIPANMRNAINAGAKAGGQLANGDWEGATLTTLESGEVDRLLGNVLGGQMAQGRYWAGVNPLYGGITPTEAKRIYSEAISARRAKKNLFLLKVSSPVSGDFSQTFNLFCTDIDLNPMNITGEKRRVGAAMVDCVQSSEAVELRITTMDDKAGSLKSWFESHAAAVAARDGTVGVPANYAITFTIQHAFVGDAKGFEGKGLYRPVSYEVGLSRREDALEEIQMTFTQLDTFMRP
ncbi:hypothetical protein FQZ97_342510 [compost metagenome]